MTAAEAWAIDQWRQSVRAGDQLQGAAWSQFLWSVNRSLVERAAHRLRQLPADEARQIAALALYRALDRFDTTSGVPFALYANYWFRKEGQAGQASAKFAVAIPPHRLSALSGGQSTGDAAVRALAATARLDATEFQPVDTAPSPEEAVVNNLTAAALRNDVARLASTTRRVVELRFGFDGTDVRSNREVARMIGLSEFTVRAHLARAFRTLRARAAP